MSITFSQAKELLLSSIIPLKATHFVPLENALNSCLAEDIIASKNLPSFDNSALDGYAFIHADNCEEYKIKATILAGDSFEENINSGECCAIMTGAKMPKNADTIVAKEDALILPNANMRANIKPKFANAVRFLGEEVKKGEILLKNGSLLSAQTIMLLASQGKSHVKVYKKPKIAVISTGSEIIEPWQFCDEEHIYNANTMGIFSLLGSFDFKADYVGIVPDDKPTCKEFFANLSLNYDCIISTGGVSQGDADFVLSSLNELNFKQTFHGIKVKPGKPILCGILDKSLIISLPGNPMACFMLGYFFAILALKKLSNQEAILPSFYAINEEEFNFSPSRTNILLGTYKNGKFHIFNHGKLSSGQIRPLANTNAMFLASSQTCVVKKGEMIEIYPF